MGKDGFSIVRGDSTRPKDRTRLVCFAPEREPKVLPVLRKDGYVEVFVLHINHDKPVLWTPILLQNYEVPAVEAGMSLRRRNTFYGLLYHQQHCVKVWWLRIELDSVALFYCVQDPLRHVWQKIPDCQKFYYGNQSLEDDLGCMLGAEWGMNVWKATDCFLRGQWVILPSTSLEWELRKGRGHLSALSAWIIHSIILFIMLGPSSSISSIHHILTPLCLGSCVYYIVASNGCGPPWCICWSSCWDNNPCGSSTLRSLGKVCSRQGTRHFYALHMPFCHAD